MKILYFKFSKHFIFRTVLDSQQNWIEITEFLHTYSSQTYTFSPLSNSELPWYVCYNEYTQILRYQPQTLCLGITLDVAHCMGLTNA